jgi:gamma-glutamyltranspeptidase/glutathione hydrolase
MTINTPYGSGITAERTGVLLNNEMDDFAIAPDQPNTYGLVDRLGANAIAARKRPRSSMTPTIVDKDGRLFMVTGSPGGPRIVSTTLLSLLNVIDYGMDASEAVSAPRFHHQWEPDVLYLEPATVYDVVDALRKRGHEVVVEKNDWAAAEAIVVDRDGAFWGGSDPRRDGLAAGY